MASANVLNFFTTFTNGGDAWGRTGQGCTIGSTTRASNCRGADNMAEFVRQRDKIVTSLTAVNADVVGLMEIQNNGDIAVTYLVEQLNATMGAGTYAVVPKPAATGTDAIRVAMIYKPKSLSLVGAALSDGDSVNNRAADRPDLQGGQRRQVLAGREPPEVEGRLRWLDAAATPTAATARAAGTPAASNRPQRLRDVFPAASRGRRQRPGRAGRGRHERVRHGRPDPPAERGRLRQRNRALRASRTAFRIRTCSAARAVTSTTHWQAHALSAQVAGVTEWHNNADEPETIDYNLERHARRIRT